jgi:hypothetical protein
VNDLPTWIDVAGQLFGTATTAAIAFVSLRAARQSNAAASTMARIERERRHTELTPHFTLAGEPWNQGSLDVRLWLELTGPVGLDRIDAMTVVIRDEWRQDMVHRIPHGRLDNEAGDLRAPLKFVAGPDGSTVDASGRAVRCGSLLIGQRIPFYLKPTGVIPRSALRMAIYAEHRGHEAHWVSLGQMKIINT